MARAKGQSASDSLIRVGPDGLSYRRARKRTSAGQEHLPLATEARFRRRLQKLFPEAERETLQDMLSSTLVDNEQALTDALERRDEKILAWIPEGGSWSCNLSDYSDYGFARLQLSFLGEGSLELHGRSFEPVDSETRVLDSVRAVLLDGKVTAMHNARLDIPDGSPAGASLHGDAQVKLYSTEGAVDLYDRARAEVFAAQHVRAADKAVIAVAESASEGKLILGGEARIEIKGLVSTADHLRQAGWLASKDSWLELDSPDLLAAQQDWDVF